MMCARECGSSWSRSDGFGALRRRTGFGSPDEVVQTRELADGLRRQSGAAHLALFGSLFLACAATSAAFGAEAKILRTAGAGPFLEGTADGVSIDRLGLVRLAQRFDRLAEISEPFLLTAERHPDGWVVGTGNDGRVLLVTDDGTVNTLLDSAEQEVFALHVVDDGTVYAGTSPQGAIYRIEPVEPGAEPEVFEVVRPGEQYIWDLERDGSGRLLVATGVEGKLLRIAESPAENGGTQSTVETLYDAADPHIRTLLVRGEEVLIGTAGEGRILRVDAGGRATSLYDADQPEITALVEGRDGVVFAAAVASEASLVDLSANGGSSGSQNSQENTGATGKAEVQVQEGAAAAGSRPAGYQGPRSEILRLSSNGSVESVAQLRRQTIYDLAHPGERLIVATGQQGKLYSWRDGGELVLEQDLDSRQLVRVLSVDDPGGGDAVAVAATDGAALFTAVEGSRPEGTYRSKVHDTRYVSSLGSLHWEGELAQGEVEFALRTGFSASPDDTWTDWRPVGSAADSGVALSLGEVPAGRYLQWRAQLRAPADQDGKLGPRLDAVEISYLQQNQRPRIQELKVLPPGEVLVPSGFNPANQAFEALTPNRDGVFVRIGNPVSERSKKLWKLGYRTLTWKAEDPNSDRLEYSLHVRSDGPGDTASATADGVAEADAPWVPVEEEFEESQISFDSTVMPDGRYRFRLTASDRQGQGDRALSAEKISGPVIVDHTPPELKLIERSGDTVRLEVRDLLLPVRSVEYSIDAGPWQNAQVADGLLDSRVERVEITRPQGARWVLIRVVDGAFNQQTHDLDRIGSPAATRRAAR